MDTPEDDDNDLKALWQTPQAIDVDALVRSVKEAQTRMKRFFYFELISSVFAILLFAWMATIDLFKERITFVVVVLVIAMIAQVWAWSWRRGLWNALAKSPAEMFQLKRRHLELDLKIARLCIWGPVVGLALGLAFGYIDDSAPNPLGLSTRTRITMLIVASSILIGSIVWGIRKKARAEKELKLLDEQINDFENHDPV